MRSWVSDGSSLRFYLLTLCSLWFWATLFPTEDTGKSVKSTNSYKTSTLPAQGRTHCLLFARLFENHFCQMLMLRSLIAAHQCVFVVDTYLPIYGWVIQGADRKNWPANSKQKTFHCWSLINMEVVKKFCLFTCFIYTIQFSNGAKPIFTFRSYLSATQSYWTGSLWHGIGTVLFANNSVGIVIFNFERFGTYNGTAFDQHGSSFSPGRKLWWVTQWTWKLVNVL